MSKPFAKALLTACLSCASIASEMASTQAADSTSSFHSIQSQMDFAVAKRSVPSISAIAIRDGRVVWIHSAGFADIEKRVPATPDTVYRIGSVSKSITGTLAAIASSRRDIDLSKPVTIYLPDLSSRSNGHFRSATLTALLNMNGGMVQAVHYRGIDSDLAGFDQSRLIGEYALAPMPPGNRFLYSNMGPELVARAIAFATGQPIDTYIRHTLFEPLGMDDTYSSAKAVPARRLARSYRSLTPYTNTFETDPISGAGYLTSPRDLARFAIFHLTGRADRGAAPLTMPELHALHEPMQGAFYNFGWGKVGDGALEILISDGQVDGGQAVILLAPQRGVGVVAIANAANDIVNEIAVATMDELAPGAAAAFGTAAADLERRRARALEPYYPQQRVWSASGTLEIHGKTLRLGTISSAKSIALTLDGKLFASGTPLPRDDGFVKWRISCAKIIPTCIEGTRADATLSLTRGNGGYDGVVAVESTLGLFPYEMHLKPAPARR